MMYPQSMQFSTYKEGEEGGQEGRGDREAPDLSETEIGYKKDLDIVRRKNSLHI